MARPEAPAAAAPNSRPSGGRAGNGLVASLRLIAALLLLALGSVLGWQARSLVQNRAAAAPVDPVEQRRQELLAAGWKELDAGVFARPCTTPCRPPRIYGGGAAAAVEVDCLKRHCGEITASFALIDASGSVLGERQIERQGRQGERLQLLAESDDPRVRRIELSTLRARAVEDGN